MRRATPFVLCLCLVVLALSGSAPAAAAEHRIGVGANYWQAVDDLVDDGFDVDEDGLSPYLTYQLIPAGIFRFELDLEYFEAGFGGSTSEAFSPQAFVLVGSGLYAGVGVGVTYSSDLPDGDFSDPFYAARVGFDFTLLPGVHLDVNANYRANTFDALDQASSDTVTLGAAVRASF